MASMYSGPLFKRLTPTDAGKGDAHVSGPTLLQEIRDFVHKPAGLGRRASVRAILLDDGPSGRLHLGEVSAIIQAQGGGGKAAETYISGINALRERCEDGDLLLIEPAELDPQAMRLTRLARGSPRFAVADARTGGRKAGLLVGGILPRTWEHDRLRPVTDDGSVLVSDFTVQGRWPQFEVTFESKDGHGRNPDYAKAIELVFERLARLQAALTGAEISSDRMRAAVVEGADASFVPAGLELPLELAGVDAGKLRKALALAGSKVGVPGDADGNTTRRTTLSFRLPGPPVELTALEEALVGAEAAPRRFENDLRSSVETAVGPASLELETSLAAIDNGFLEWRDALDEGARFLTGSRRWIDGEGITFEARTSSHRKGAVDVRLGVRSSGAPWTVEINAPRVAADPNGLATIARDASGRRFLIRQGRLRPNPDSNGEIRGQRFRELSGLTPVGVSGGATPQIREWFVVANLDGPSATVRAQTAAFVVACASARARSLGVDIPEEAPPLTASGETGGTYVLPARASMPERLVERIHGEVWMALAASLKASGTELFKLRHRHGYEVDGLVHTGDRRVLIEIKSGASAADVYEGVGQLLLYAEMLELKSFNKVLLLPFPPSEPLVAACRRCGVEVHRYTDHGEGEATRITFGAELLGLCGVKVGPA